MFVLLAKLGRQNKAMHAKPSIGRFDLRRVKLLGLGDRIRSSQQQIPKQLTLPSSLSALSQESWPLTSVPENATHP